MRRRLLVLLMLVLAPLGLAAAAHAHQQKIAITAISLNPRTGMIEIAHQVPHHDAEHALRFRGDKAADIVASTKSREAFAAYVTQRFLLEVDGVRVEPAYVGSEIDGGSLWVYQEVPAPKTGQATLRFNSQILTDVWARQVNRVNVGSGTRPQTFVFKAGEGAREAVLAR